MKTDMSLRKGIDVVRWFRMAKLRYMDIGLEKDRCKEGVK